MDRSKNSGPMQAKQYWKGVQKREQNVHTKDETEMKAGNGKKEWKVESGSVFFLHGEYHLLSKYSAAL